MSAKVVKDAKEEIDARSFLPKEWDDEQTMKVRFAEFRARNANPEGFDIKLQFWINCIDKWCSEMKTCAFSIEDVQKAFVRGTSRVHVNCLKLVISNMMRKKLLIHYDEFTSVCKSRKNDGWSSWGLNLLAKPISFGWSLLSSSDDSVDDCDKIDPQIKEETAFINLNAVKEISSFLFHEYGTKADCAPYNYEVVEKSAKDKFGISNRDLNLCIMYLKSQKKVDIFEENNLKLVKFGENVGFNDVDVSFLRLENAKDLIESEIKKCEIKMDECKEEARQCLLENNKIKAKSLLKKKKRLEILIEKKETQLDNVLLLMEELSNTDSHKVVLNAYQKCVEALKQAQVSTDVVENTLLDVEDVVEQTTRISEIGKIWDSNVDDEDIESELNSMFGEVSKKPVNKEEEEDDEELKSLVNRLKSLREPDDDLPSPQKKAVATASSY